MATLEEIKTLLESHKDSITNTITEKFEALDAKFGVRISKIESELDDKNIEIESLKARLLMLEDAESTADADLHARIDSLEAELDDQVNRGMRNNIILRGIAEEDNETWEMTKATTAEVIARHLQRDKSQVEASIERAHRGGKKRTTTSSDGQPPPPRRIFARLRFSDTAQDIFTSFRELAVKKPNMPIRIEMQYSERVTRRRNEALLERKSLLHKKEIASGYVDYPAKLMVKRKKGDDKYILYQKF